MREKIFQVGKFILSIPHQPRKKYPRLEYLYCLSLVKWLEKPEITSTWIAEDLLKFYPYAYAENVLVLLPKLQTLLTSPTGGGLMEGQFWSTMDQLVTRDRCWKTSN